MKKLLYVFLMVTVVGLLGGTIANAQDGFEDWRDFLSCDFTCLYDRDGFKELTILTVVNQGAPVEGCVDIVFYNASGHSSLGTSIKLNHNDLDKLNVCKMLYEAKRAGLIDEIPKTGALQVRLQDSWISDLIYNFDLENFSVNAWTTDYTSLRTFYFRDTEVNQSAKSGIAKSNCIFVTKDHDYREPDDWIPPVFIQDTGGYGDWSECAPNGNNNSVY